LIELAQQSLECGEQCVLCTVVRLDGSGYGRPGARLLITESGEREGYISGGCLEKDLCRQAWDVTASGDRLLAFDTRGNAVETNRYNTGCEGVVSVLCQRLNSPDAFPLRALMQTKRLGEISRMLTVYRSDSPRFHVGDAWVEMCDARETNCPRVDLPAECFTAMLTSRRNRTISFTVDQGESIDAAIEVIRPPRRLVIFGAGDDVIPVVRNGAMLGWEVIVVGHRPEMATADRFRHGEAGEVAVRCGPPHLVASQLKLHGLTDVLVMTHDFDRDVRLLPVLLDSPARSIGLLGPKRRLGRLVQRLYEQGRVLRDSDIDRIRSPIGLDIGAASPEEISISIISELIAMEHDREGGSLHRYQQSLHAPTPHSDLSQMEEG
jgi:xanthine/CO dehydrogenase XdhC/CoxF family maturation factor